MVCLFALHQGWEVIPLRGCAIDNSENGRTESLRQCDAVEVQHNGLCARPLPACNIVCITGNEMKEKLSVSIFSTLLL